MQPILFFKSLSDETRLLCLLLLVRRQSLCVCDFQSMLQLSQPKISRHLADLRNQQLVEAERRGKWMYYRLHPALPAWCLEVLTLAAQQDTSRLDSLIKQLTCDC